MGGRASREKGKRGERMVADDLRKALPMFAELIKRGWQSRQGSDDSDIVGVPGFWFESKNLAKFNTAPLDQAIGDCEGRPAKPMPVAVIRAMRKKPVVMMRWEDFLALLAELMQARDAGKPLAAPGDF